MPWVRIDDAFYDHPKFIEAGPCGIALWLTALAWSNRNLTDGMIPWGQLPRLCNFEGLSLETAEIPGLAAFGEDVTGIAVARRLAALDIFEEVEGGFVIHDYLDFQRSAEQIQDGARKERERWHRRTAGNAAVVPDSTSHSGNGSVPNSGDPPAPLHAESEVESEPTPRVSQPQPQEKKKRASAPRSAAYEQDFEDWWAKWPRKVDKAEARARYATRRKNGASHADLCRARDNYVAANVGTDQRFLKHGATFLAPETWSEWLAGPPEGASTNGHRGFDPSLASNRSST